MKFEKISSVVTVAIKKNQKFLLLKDEKSGAWYFPSEEFDDNLNGNLDDTVKRVVRAVTDLILEEIDYLGSFIKKERDRILIGYNFSIEDFEGALLANPHKWLTKNEIENIKLDKIDENTLTFLKLHKDLI